MQNQADDLINHSISHVVLVHGTWAREAKWTQSDSPVPNVIANLLKLNPSQFVNFCWSGKNMASARIKASDELSDMLKNLLEESSESVLVIGHSHGGNLSLNAIEKLDNEQQLRIRLVCIGTPFLVGKEYDLSKFFGLVEKSSHLLIGSLVTLLVLIPYSLLVTTIFGTSVQLDFQAWQANLNWLQKVLWFFPSIIICLLFVLIIAACFSVGKSYSRKTSSDLKCKIQDSRKKIIDDLGAPKPSLFINVLILRASADEAYWWLRIVSSFSSLPVKVAQIIFKFLFHVLPVGIVIFYLLFGLYAKYVLGATGAIFVALIFIGLIIYILIMFMFRLGVATGFLIRTLPISFGMEPLLAGAIIERRVDNEMLSKNIKIHVLTFRDLVLYEGRWAFVRSWLNAKSIHSVLCINSVTGRAIVDWVRDIP